MSTHDVVIVGAGPAGLAAARELHALGVRDVVVLERERDPGGVPRHCGHRAFGWPEFRRLLTGPEYARRLAAIVRVELRTETSVIALRSGGALHVASPDGLATVTGRCVLLATGARETPRAARLVSGTRAFGTLTTGALQQLVYLARIRPFARAVIVGSELVSFSALLTLRHAGIEPVAMIEEGARILAPRPADWIARLLLRTPVLTRTRLLAIRGDERVSGVEIERDGEARSLACDGVVFSGRFVPEAALLPGSPLVHDPATGGPAVDQYGRCSDPAYFAAGNLLRPVEPSWNAWAEGRAVARAIAARLHGGLPDPQRTVAVQFAAPLRYACPQRFALPAAQPPALSPNLRVQRAARGTLRALSDGRALWSRALSALPERRIDAPWPDDLSYAHTLSFELREGT